MVILSRLSMRSKRWNDQRMYDDGAYVILPSLYERIGPNTPKTRIIFNYENLRLMMIFC
jgi:hypothetical protein